MTELQSCRAAGQPDYRGTELPGRRKRGTAELQTERPRPTDSGNRHGRHTTRLIDPYAILISLIHLNRTYIYCYLWICINMFLLIVCNQLILAKKERNSRQKLAPTNGNRFHPLSQSADKW